LSVADAPSPAFSAVADLAGSLVWIAFGGAVLYGSWTMDRLEKMHINPYTAPGLVPGLLGAGLLLFGILLLVRSVRTNAQGNGAQEEKASGWGRLILALALCLGYGVGLVGRGLPFWAATLIFVFVSIAVLQWPERRARQQIGRGVLVAAACAAATSLGVTLVFQELFLVRLP
jgi:hypothetical protein